ncbi:hypothetical protein CTI12_AA347170 [Artemisia annua]|uniref:Secreted protein n=1 Tax=Artemisia annua TaxID=35608 RepID=A0A2U1MS82_ARTAN|nr:hypothetical protein CTI12_AA347170 [Artemisia annua]
MLHLFFAVAFSAVPLTLYVPPVRSLNLFVQTMEELWRESSGYTHRVYPRLRQWVRCQCVLDLRTSNELAVMTKVLWSIFWPRLSCKPPVLRKT